MQQLPLCRVELLRDGDVCGVLPGQHTVFEADSGSLLQALRLKDSFMALRRGRVQTFQVSRQLPSASLVRYPPPFGPISEVECGQVLQRAEGFLGLDISEVRERLLQLGLSDQAGVEAVAESLVSFCVTGVCRLWNVEDAHKRARRASATAEVRESSLKCSGTAARVLRCDDVSNIVDDDAGHRNSKPLPGALPAVPEKLQEKAISTAIHVGCRGPAARVAGAAAAMTVEGYALYKEIGRHCEQLEVKNISSDQFTERICESTVSSSGRAIGSLAGAAMGQASIPVPVVGAVIGGVAGAACGGFYANSLVRGAWRLSGGKAKGGDDIVRCVEHTTDMSTPALKKVDSPPDEVVACLADQAKLFEASTRPELDQQSSDDFL
ncbi:unnamed protein product [Symbiodinium pilosum]|uniref:Uncharacterized protein n=1 Tax=Symbiodinium pilosum TaxID=2952 RepID=A0A812JYC4_SYMPI|nr:unnamed protein product [Symbiodinium pilosum]